MGTCVQLSILLVHPCKPAQLPAIVQLATNTTASVTYCTGSVLHRVSVTLHCTCHRDKEQQGCVPTSDRYTFHLHIMIVYYHAIVECIKYNNTHVIETWSTRAMCLPVTASKDSPVASFPQLPAPWKCCTHNLSPLIQCQESNSRDSNSLTTTNAIVVLHPSTRRSTVVSFDLSQHDNFDSYNATNMLMTTEGF